MEEESGKHKHAHTTGRPEPLAGSLLLQLHCGWGEQRQSRLAGDKPELRGEAGGSGKPKPSGGGRLRSPASSFPPHSRQVTALGSVLSFLPPLLPSIPPSCLLPDFPPFKGAQISLPHFVSSLSLLFIILHPIIGLLQKLNFLGTDVYCSTEL